MLKSIKRGEVWLVSLGDGNGSIQGGERPCVVISNDMANMHSPVVHVVPMTTRKKNKLPTHIEIDFDCGIIKDSIAMVEQTRLINTFDFSKRIGVVSEATLTKLEIATFVQFGVISKAEIELFMKFNIMSKIKHTLKTLKNKVMATT